MSESRPFTTKIRDFDGETPLQVLARQGEYASTTMSVQERFPYYTAFPFSWYRACDTAELARGAVRAVRLLARDLVVWRDESGVAHVMDAYCPHLGANLALGGRVEGGNLVCPYHWWEWDGDGRNARIPYSDRVNAKASVRVYPTVDVNGFVMFWYHPDAAQAPLWDVPDLAEYAGDAWTEPIVARWTVRCPWQELAENGPDFVHLKTVHGAATVPEIEEITYDGWCNRIRARVDFATPRGPQPGRIDTDSWGPGFSLARFSGILDACFVSAQTPIDFEWTEVSFNYTVHVGDGPDAARRARLGAALVADLKRQEEEDILIFDHKIYQPAPRLSRADGPIARFRSWAAQFYQGGDPRAVNH